MDSNKPSKTSGKSQFAWNDTIRYLTRNGVKPLENQPQLPGAESGRKIIRVKPEKDRRTKKVNDKIPIKYFDLMLSLCYNVNTKHQALLLSEAQTGQVANELKLLKDAGVDLELIYKFGAKWKRHWKSGINSRNYQYPRPSQIREHWAEFFPDKPKQDIKKAGVNNRTIKALYGKQRNK